MSDRASGCYSPGLVMVGLGAAAANRHNLAEIAAPFAQRLADRTGNTVYVAVHSGMMAVCIDRVEGDFPIKICLDCGRPTTHGGERERTGDTGGPAR